MKEMIRLQQSEQSAKCVCKASAGGISTRRKREKKVGIERHSTDILTTLRHDHIVVWDPYCVISHQTFLVCKFPYFTHPLLSMYTIDTILGQQKSSTNRDTVFSFVTILEALFCITDQPNNYWWPRVPLSNLRFCHFSLRPVMGSNFVEYCQCAQWPFVALLQLCVYWQSLTASCESPFCRWSKRESEWTQKLCSFREALTGRQVRAKDAQSKELAHTDIKSAINGLAKRIIRPAKQSAKEKEKSIVKYSSATVETLSQVNNRSSQASLEWQRLCRMSERLACTAKASES